LHHGEAGAVYAVPGGSEGSWSLGDEKVALKLTGEGKNDWAGYSLAGVGDNDGDGLGEALVGARQESSNGNEAGAVYLVAF